jgi:hypothetical protein
MNPADPHDRPRSYFLRLADLLPYIGITVIYLIAIVPAPGRPIPGGTFDDGLFFRLSTSLLNNQWLGSWDSLTLAKGPLHSILSSLAFKAGLHVYAYKRLFYLIASLLFVAIGMGKARRWISLLTLIALLTDPFLFGEGGMRNLREGTYIPLQIITFAIGLWILDELSNRHRPKPPVYVYLASLGMGLSFGLLAITREARILLWVEAGIFFLLAGYKLVASKSRQKIASSAISIALIALMAVLGIASPVVALRSINSSHYGAPISTNLEEGYLPKLYAKLAGIKLKGEQPIARVTISEKTLAELRQSSANHKGTLASVIDHLDPSWKGYICKMHPETCNEYGGGYMMWALRMSIGSLLPKGSDEADFQRLARRAWEDAGSICKSNSRLSCESSNLGYFPSPSRWGFQNPLKEFGQELKPILARTMIPNPSPQGIPSFYAYNEWPPAAFIKLRLNSLGTRKISLEESFRWTKSTTFSRYLGASAKGLMIILSLWGLVGVMQSFYLCLRDRSAEIWKSAPLDAGSTWLLFALILHILVYAALGFTSFPGDLYVTMASPLYIGFMGRFIANHFTAASV